MLLYLGVTGIHLTYIYLQLKFDKHQNNLACCLQLERMKNENYLFPKDHHCDPDFQDSQRELVQLQKVYRFSSFLLADEVDVGSISIIFFVKEYYIISTDHFYSFFFS